MMKGDKEKYDDNDVIMLIERFEEMLNKDSQSYFDVEEFEDIIDYYFSRNNTRKANKAINFACELHPDAFIFILRKAQLYISINKTQKALDLIKKVETIDPNNYELFMTKGAIYSRLKKYEKAIEEYNKALKETEDPEDIFINIAFEYENMEDFPQAIKYLKKVINLNPDNDAAIYEIAFCFEHTGQLEESINFYNDFLNNNPYSSVAWYNLGITYNILELFEKSIDAFDYAIAIDENFSSAYFNKGNSLICLERYEDAVKVFEEVLNIEIDADDDAYTYYYLGECNENLKNYKKAQEYYQKAIEIDETIADAWIGLGSVLDDTDKTSEGFKCIKKAVDLEPLNSEYLYMLGDIQLKLGLYKEAIESYCKVSNIDTFNEDIWLDYSDACLKSGDTNMSIDVILRGIDIQPENVKLRYRIGNYMLKNGKEKEAYKMIETALQMNFSMHNELFEYDNILIKNQQIIDLIELYKK